MKSLWLPAAFLLLFIVSVVADGHTYSSRKDGRSELVKTPTAESSVDQSELDLLGDFVRNLTARGYHEEGRRAGSELDDPARMLAGKKTKFKAKKKKKKVPPNKKVDKNKSPSTPTKTQKKK